MKGFVLGLLAATLAFGGYLYWKSRETASTSILAVKPAVDAGVPAGKKKRRGRGAARVRPRSTATADQVALSEAEPEPEPVKLTPADLKVVGQGDDLSRPDVVRLDMTGDDSPAELSQDDIDARFRAEESSILDCISAARPDPETYVPGRVTVKFRIQRTGAVRGVRVEAPAILQKGGLTGCIRSIVLRLSFPRSGSSQLVSYPFTLS